jgi:hypothetical protein
MQVGQRVRDHSRPCTGCPYDTGEPYIGHRHREHRAIRVQPGPGVGLVQCGTKPVVDAMGGFTAPDPHDRLVPAQAQVASQRREQIRLLLVDPQAPVILLNLATQKCSMIGNLCRGCRIVCG